MAKGYRPVDRDQQFWMPPDMREWLPADHAVWVLIDVVDRLDTSAFHAHRNVGGVGRAGYHPDMLLALLIWAWAQGVRSSRRVERLCQENVAFRVICAQDAPDHVTLHRFRVAAGAAMPALFVQVLRLCARVGMGQVGTIALDGVKIAANASRTANRDAEGLRRLAERIAAEHAATDEAEDALFGEGRRGDEVGEGLVNPASRRARIAAALAELEAEQQAAEQDEQARRDTAAEQVTQRAEGRAPTGRVPDDVAVEVAELELGRAIAAQQAKIDSYPRRRAQMAAAGRPVKPPAPVDQHHMVIKWRTRLQAALTRRARREQADRAEDRKPVRNLTDPDSRLMPLRGGGWLQGYNCQAVTSADGLILATSVSNNPTDVIAFEPMMRAAQAAVEQLTQARDQDDASTIGVLLADAGYLSETNLTTPGPDRLIALGKTRTTEHAAANDPTHGPPPDNAGPIAAMAHRLRTPEGCATYRQRSHIAETPFGHAKHNLGFRQFSRRGLAATTAEWTFHGAVHNLIKAITTGRLALLPG